MLKRQEKLYIVEGFAFSTEKEAEQAKKEREGIKYIKSKADMDNPEMVLQIYNKMVEEKMFVTAVGYAYLIDLREYLTAIPFIQNQDIHPIEILHPDLEESLKEQKQIQNAKIQKLKKAANKKEKESETKKKYKVSLVCNLILVLSVIFMFLISATGNHPNILNYEAELINRYSAWEQELSEREAALREKGM